MRTNPWKLLDQYPGTIVKALAAITREKSSSCYIAGGTIRDWFLGVESQDLDITVDSNSFGWAEEFAQKLAGRFVPLDAEEDVARYSVIFHFPKQAIEYGKWTKPNIAGLIC